VWRGKVVGQGCAHRWPARRQRHRTEPGIGGSYEGDRSGGHREAVCTDPSGVHVGSGRKEFERREHVETLTVSPACQLSLALAAGARIEEEHSMPMPCEQRRLRQELGSIREEPMDERHP